jgi:hypothetical protein
MANADHLVFFFSDKHTEVSTPEDDASQGTDGAADPKPESVAGVGNEPDRSLEQDIADVGNETPASLAQIRLTAIYHEKARRRGLLSGSHCRRR